MASKILRVNIPVCVKSLMSDRLTSLAATAIKVIKVFLSDFLYKPSKSFDLISLNSSISSWLFKSLFLSVSSLDSSTEFI